MRVAAEVDDVTAEALEIGDQRVKDAVEVGGELLGPALRAELVRQRLGQRREARDVGEQRRTADSVRHRAPGGQRASPVPGDVRREAPQDFTRGRGRGAVLHAVNGYGDSCAPMSAAPPLTRGKPAPR